MVKCCLQALEKDFIQDVTSAYRDVDMDKNVLNRVAILLKEVLQPCLYQGRTAGHVTAHY